MGLAWLIGNSTKSWSFQTSKESAYTARQKKHSFKGHGLYYLIQIKDKNNKPVTSWAS